MRKSFFAFIAALCLLSTFTVGASAHSTTAASTRSVQNVRVVKTMLKITPNSTGGGCSLYRTNRTQDISIKACISYTYPDLLADAYASFFQHNASGVSACSVQFFVYRTDGYLIDNTYKAGCVGAAVHNTFGAHFGPDSIFDVGFGFSYYCYAQVNLYFNDGTAHYASSPNSPNVTP